MYSVGVPCISSSLYSSFCNLDPKSVSSSYNGITITTTTSQICCSTNNCNDQAYFITSYGSNQIYSSVSIAISLRVNLPFSSDYSDLNSAVSLTFIQNLKNFVIIY